MPVFDVLLLLLLLPLQLLPLLLLPPAQILQSPNTPLDVSVSGDLWRLLKLSTALNSFLPLSPAGCAGGLLLLPAVLPVPQADVAADYRFAAAPSGRVAVPYSIRLQRCAGRLPKGAHVTAAGA